MARNIFTRGEFTAYRVDSLNESMQDIPSSYYEYAQKKVTVFISHKHDDLDELKGIIGFLEKNYNVKTYIDSRDPTMPAKTSGETAIKIRDRIKRCDKFILLATDGAIESKWCNWELGYGDAKKYKLDNIALFPMKDQGEYDNSYKGNEYMDIYPHIVRRINEKYSSGENIPDGYYVRCKKQNQDAYIITPLNEWIHK